jgi:hypothetical protein
MPGKPTTVAAYLASLPADRRAALEQVRKTILDNLDPSYEEGMQYGMIAWYVPHRILPQGYHCDPSKPLCFAALGAQKNHLSLHLMSVYGSPELRAWFEREWARSGKKLDMGKSCVRFRSADDLALEVIGEAIRRMPAKKYIAEYQKVLAAMDEKRAERRTAKQRPTAARRPATKRARSGR